MKTGIEIYDNVLSEEECNFLIENFDSDNRKVTGIFSNNKQDFSKKKSIDLGCNFSNPAFILYNNVILKNLDSCIKEFISTYPILSNIGTWGINTEYNIQKYNDGDGYYDLHCEHGKEFPKRILAWMIYLNDAISGTEYPYQDLTISPRTGRCVIWSSSWIHAHKGVTPNKGKKYIATGWMSFNDT